MVTLTLCRGLWKALQEEVFRQEKVAEVQPCMPLDFQYLFPPNLQGIQSGQGNHRWLVGALLVKKHTLIIHRSSSLGRKAPLRSHPLHEVKEESTEQPFLPRKPSHPSQDVYHGHILPSSPRVTLFHFLMGLLLFPLLFSVMYVCKSHRLPG